MFNRANTGPERQLHRVKGRVICFTNSQFVEFVDSALRYSYPLFHGGNPGPLSGVTFVIEVDGFISFDNEAFVKLAEVGPYQRFDFGLTSFVQTIAADPFKPLITDEPVHVYAQDERGASIVNFNITTVEGGTQAVFFTVVNPQPTPEAAAPILARDFPAGSEYRGPSGYPGYRQYIAN